VKAPWDGEARGIGGKDRTGGDIAKVGLQEQRVLQYYENKKLIVKNIKLVGTHQFVGAFKILWQLDCRIGMKMRRLNRERSVQLKVSRHN
jgi:hypothetical protein